MKALLDSVDWGRPWLAPYRTVAARLCDGAAGATSVAALLNRALAGGEPIELAAGPLRFVAQTNPTLAGEPYEAVIARTACVPTRDNLHDLFNGLVWLRFPQIKRRLNALQAEAIARHGVVASRGALRDALTLWDENGAWLQPVQPLAEALRVRDWQAAFVTQRAAWLGPRTSPPILFGHALLEKLCQPRKAITAHAWLLPTAAQPHAWLLDRLTATAPELQPFQPLPVLGVPGWWPANDAAAFYDDAEVFRPARRSEPTTAAPASR